ncbi:MAG: SixA phosphatase family protein [Bacteroidota bacterium]
MKRHLYLVRHADSTWSEEIGNDFQRIVTEEGERNATEMGRRLKEKKVKPDLIMTSPALRAKKTAEIIASELGVKKGVIDEYQRIYEATTRILLEVINFAPDDVKNLMLVGHNPAISRIVEYLTNETLENIPPAGVVSMTFEVERWPYVAMGAGEYNWFDYPHNSIHSNEQTFMK